MATPLKRKAADITTSTAKKAKGNASITSFFSSPSTSSKPAAQAAAASTSSAPPSSPLNTKEETSPAQSQATAPSTASSTTVTGTPAAPAASIFNRAKESKAATMAEGSQASTSTSKFDKAKWVEKLTTEQKDLLALEIEYLHESWLGPLKEAITTPSFLELKRFLKREHDSGKQIFPPAADVYSWSRHTPLPTVKAVILGQDPYHNINQAHGLCFSVRPPCPAPPSLLNIYKLLKSEYPDTFHPPPTKAAC